MKEDGSKKVSRLMTVNAEMCILYNCIQCDMNELMAKQTLL